MRPPRRHTTGDGGPESAVVRCVAYARKSTSEGLDRDFTSLDNQQEAAEAFVRSQQHEGWQLLPDRYIDGGFSGGTTERPALQRLLADIDAGKIDNVIVYKVDRLSRSLLDFLNLTKLFEKHGVNLVSVTEPINTRTPMGRAFLNILMSFGQMEREVTAERTRDKLRAARRKGKFVGGGLILGYDRHPDGGRLVVNEAEAKRVREVFRLFLETGSLVATVEELNRRGWTLKRWTTKASREYGGGVFDVINLRRMLQNPAYIAEVHFEGKVIPAEHDAIVDRETWDAVQAALDAGTGKPQRRSTKNPSLLAGILRCAPCDSAMTPTYSGRNRRRYRYYLCLKAHRHGWASCPSKSVPAVEVEKFVVDQLRAIGRDPQLVAATVEQARQGITARRRELEDEIREAQMALDAAHLTARARIGTAARNGRGKRQSGNNVDVVALEERLAAAKNELAALRGQRIDADDLKAALAAFDPVWNHLTSYERARIVQLLIERIDYDGRSGSLKISFAPAGVRTLAVDAGRGAEASQ